MSIATTFKIKPCLESEPMTSMSPQWQSLTQEDRDLLSTAFLLAANTVMMADTKVDREEIDAMVSGLGDIAKTSASALVCDAARSLIDGFARIAIRGDAEDPDSYPVRLAATRVVVERLSTDDRHAFGHAVRALCWAVGHATGSEADAMMSAEETAMAGTVMRSLGFDPAVHDPNG